VSAEYELKLRVSLQDNASGGLQQIQRQLRENVVAAGQTGSEYGELRSKLRDLSFEANAAERLFKAQYDTLFDLVGVFGSVGSAISSVNQMITQYNVAQIRVTEAQEKLASLQDKYNEAVGKYGENSEQARKAADALANAQRDLEQAQLAANTQFLLFIGQSAGLAKNLGSLAAKVYDLITPASKLPDIFANIASSSTATTTGVNTLTTAFTGLKGALVTAASIAGIAGAFILLQDAVAKAVPSLEDFVRGARDWRDVMRPNFQLTEETTDALVEHSEATQTAADGWGAFTQSLRQTPQLLENVKNELKNTQDQLKLLDSAVGAMSKFYDVTLAVEQALGRDVQLTEDAAESKERLAATEQLLGFITQNLGLVQQATQFYMLGATDAGDMLLNIFTAMTDAMADGLVSQEEFVGILQQLGVDSQNVAGSLHKILVEALNAVKASIEGNISSVQGLIGALTQLDGMTVTYTIVERRVEEGSETPGPESGITSGATSPPAHYQFGTLYVPRDMLAFLHRGEAVLSRREAELYRRGVNRISINLGGIYVAGSMTPETVPLLRSQLEELMDRYFREGSRKIGR